MNSLGEHLKECRKQLGLSQKAVTEKTGITDSRLSKIENGQLDCPGRDLRLLAKVYGVPVVSMFLKAGYLIPEDLNEYQYVFRGVDKLDDEDRQHIQDEIDYMIRKKDTPL